MGPLAATFSASDESRLPFCCRRHGIHHCTGSMSMAATMADTASEKPLLTAPATCPSFPGYAAAIPSAPQALTAASCSPPALLARPHSCPAARAAARLSQIRTRAGRAPPASDLA
jgi:hypothetical protein